jgi:hypothetical protein
MSEPDNRQWAPMATAPRDGTLVLVKIRASEQGPGEFDMVRWAENGLGEEGWLATDSDPFARVVYADNELAYWMPLPSQLPKLRSGATETATAPMRSGPEEADGSAI